MRKTISVSKGNDNHLSKVSNIPSLNYSTFCDIFLSSFLKRKPHDRKIFGIFHSTIPNPTSLRSQRSLESSEEITAASLTNRTWADRSTGFCRSIKITSIAWEERNCTSNFRASSRFHGDGLFIVYDGITSRGKRSVFDTCTPVYQMKRRLFRARERTSSNPLVCENNRGDEGLEKVSPLVLLRHGGLLQPGF